MWCVEVPLVIMLLLSTVHGQCESWAGSSCREPLVAIYHIASIHDVTVSGLEFLTALGRT